MATEVADRNRESFGACGGEPPAAPARGDGGGDRSGGDGGHCGAVVALMVVVVITAGRWSLRCGGLCGVAV